MANKTESVSRTTAMFVRVLGEVLRKHFNLQFEVPEHWDFTYGDQAVNPDGAGYHYECTLYIGTAGAKVRDLCEKEKWRVDPIEVRVIIDRTNWTALPSHGSELWHFHIWVKSPFGVSLRTLYGTPKLMSFSYSVREDQLLPSDQAPSIDPLTEMWLRRVLQPEPTRSYVPTGEGIRTYPY